MKKNNMNYSFPFLIINLFFHSVYVVERDTCSFGPPIRVGMVEEWGKVDKTTASNLIVFSGI